MVIVLSLGILVLATAVWVLSCDRIRHKREQHIRTYVFSAVLFDRLRKLHPHLTTKECQLVARALRQFFLVYLNSGRAYVGMPSRVTDDLWHEFILHTQAYGRFCREAFGRYLHHAPAGALGMGSKEDQGLRRTWRFACREENIDPNKPTRLPLLFALDEKLKIDGGVRYTLGQFERQEQATPRPDVREGTQPLAVSPPVRHSPVSAGVSSATGRLIPVPTERGVAAAAAAVGETDARSSRWQRAATVPAPLPGSALRDSM